MEEMFPTTDDIPGPSGNSTVQDFGSILRNELLSYAISSRKDITLKYVYERADLGAAMIDHDYCHRPFVEFWINQHLKTTSLEADEIQENTKLQSGSRRWFREREWRLTASKFGDIICTTERRDFNKLCESLLSVLQLHTIAMSHGMIYEDEAIASFCRETGITTTPCGLFINPDFPFLGATPDALVTDGLGVVEVKCPYVGRNDLIVPGPKFPFLHRVDGNICLKRNHKYYYQI